jgi:S1-C subfamily serine protease
MITKIILKGVSIVVLIFLGGFLSGAQAYHALYTEEERNNIAIYEKAADGVVNITTTAVPMDFFLKAFPAKGSASGVIIDTEGRILTNHHVVVNA